MRGDDNGKPIERWGRKATGLTPRRADTAAGLPKASKTIAFDPPAERAAASSP